MPTINEKIKEFAEEKDLKKVVIANEEGLSLASNTEEVEEEAAEGVHMIKKQLLPTNRNYLISSGEEGSKVFYKAEDFYYILQPKDSLKEEVIHDLHQLVKEDRKEKERKREKRLQEARKDGRKREKRLEKIRKEKKRRRERRKKLRYQQIVRSTVEEAKELANEIENPEYDKLLEMEKERKDRVTFKRWLKRQKSKDSS